MAWLSAFKFRLNTLGIVLIPVCIAIDWAGHAIASGLRLPLFLDSIGTILGGILAGPWVGGLAGFITNLISSGTIDPIWQRQPRGWIGIWILCFLVASIGSTPLNIGLYQGQSGIPFGDAIYTALVNAHFPTWIAAYVDEAAVDLPDKLITALVAVLIYQGLPRRYRALFRLYQPDDDAEGERSPARA
ncbi:MAG: hypothetical protein E6J00_11455 [Chloroflexi bacterium]|nr:MAG: hypothetical protein E6J00_11455 [Chloroflexota bacterium]